jgi:serine/threonine protein kinase
VERLVKANIHFVGIDVRTAQTTFAEIKRIYDRVGGCSMTFEPPQSSGGNTVTAIGRLIAEKTDQIVGQTCLPIGIKPGAQASSGFRPRTAKAPPPIEQGDVWSKVSCAYSNIVALGKGGFAQVSSATRKLDGKRVALKYIVRNTDECRKCAGREVECLTKFRRQPGCLQLIDVIESRDDIVIVTELMNHGDLETALQLEFNNKPFPGWATAKSKAAFRLALTMRAFHRGKWVHRDFKPQNILLDEKREAVLADFGLARSLTSSSFATEETDLTMGAGTLLFMAPELFDGEQPCNQSVDVYAFGVLLYSMFAGGKSLLKLFDNRKQATSASAIMRQITSGIRYERLNNMSEGYWDLITQCWSQVPSERPTFDRIVEVMFANISNFLFRESDAAVVQRYVQELK